MYIINFLNTIQDYYDLCLIHISHILLGGTDGMNPPQIYKYGKSIINHLMAISLNILVVYLSCKFNIINTNHFYSLSISIIIFYILLKDIIKNIIVLVGLVFIITFSIYRNIIYSIILHFEFNSLVVLLIFFIITKLYILNEIEFYKLVQCYIGNNTKYDYKMLIKKELVLLCKYSKNTLNLSICKYDQFNIHDVINVLLEIKYPIHTIKMYWWDFRPYEIEYIHNNLFLKNKQIYHIYFSEDDEFFTEFLDMIKNMKCKYKDLIYVLLLQKHCNKHFNISKNILKYKIIPLIYTYNYLL